MNFRNFGMLALLATVMGYVGVGLDFANLKQDRSTQNPVSSGRFVSPFGSSINVGSFPDAMAITPDGRFIVVSDSGYRQSLTVIDSSTGKSLAKIDAPKGSGYYYGLKFVNENDSLHLLVSTGSYGKVLDYPFNEATGQLEDGVSYVFFKDTADEPIAGVDLSTDGTTLYAAINTQAKKKPYNGSVISYNLAQNRQFRIAVPGYPLDVVSAGPYEFVSSERDGVVTVIEGNKVIKDIETGKNTSKLLLSKNGKDLYVSNSGSDTISEIDTHSLEVKRTMLVRPPQMHGLPGATPLGLAFDNHGNLLVTLGDLNAVAVLNLKSGQVEGMIPVGWYPTADAYSPLNDTLYVANAKGNGKHVPNKENQGPNGSWGKYILNILEGTVSKISLKSAMANLANLSNEVLHNASLTSENSGFDFHNPGIKHVIYIIKENRTYDQVLGDVKEGDGDASICLFGKDVTPNEHALVKRFTLLDNFYTCADVSADGWNWSTSGMINEYTARTVPNNYSGRQGPYNFEGENNGIANDLKGLPDVAESPGGYIWDDALKSRLTLRNYGFFVQYGSAKKLVKTGQIATKKDLLSITCPDFREFDLDYPDSDLFKIEHFSFPNQLKKFGPNDTQCRFDAWKKDFDESCKTGQFPQLELVRFMCDHTAGTRTGNLSPSAMAADNDYAVGQLVQAVSHSRFWNSTCICILEDDSQNGYDHVDCHRSPALVISPYMERNRHDSSFYNTDSMLRTIELLLGMAPMNSYDADARPIGGFEESLINSEPYNAILPDRAIASQVNGENAFMAKVSNRIVDTYAEHTQEDLMLNPIIWGSVKGAKILPPPIKGNPLGNSKDSDDD